MNNRLLQRASQRSQNLSLFRVIGIRGQRGYKTQKNGTTLCGEEGCV
jgi:hypothetical protein